MPLIRRKAKEEEDAKDANAVKASPASRELDEIPSNKSGVQNEGGNSVNNGEIEVEVNDQENDRAANEGDNGQNQEPSNPGKDSNQGKETGIEEPKVEMVELTLKQAMFHYRTPYIFVMILLSSSFPFYIVSNFKSYASTDISDDTFLTVVGSFGAVMNGISRGFWATLQNMFGFKIIYLVILIIEIAVAFTIVAIHEVKPLYLIWVVLAFG